MRVSLRLALAILVVICGIFSVHAFLSVRFHQRLYVTDVQYDHHVMARGLEPATAALWREGGPDAAIRLLEEANEREANTRVRWVVPGRPPDSPHGAALSREDVARLQAGEELTLTVAGPDRILLYYPVMIDGEAVGAIEISESLETRDRYIRDRVLRATLAAAAMVVVGGLSSYFLGNRLVGEPVRLLIERARRIGAGDFSGPLALERPRSEFSELATEMNAMADRLAIAREQVERETQARIAALDQLRHADRLTTVGRLAAGIAHELGTPLNVVSERARMIAQGETETPEELVESANIMHEQTMRMAAIVRQLLDFARRGSPERSRVDLADLARGAVRLIEPVLGQDRVSVAVHVQEDEAAVSVDANQIQQALTNLLVNAADVSPPDQPVRIEVAREPGAGEADIEPMVRLSVRDRGPGIPSDVLPQIFDPFFTTKPIGKGTGLGLSVAQGIVRDNGGRIEVESGPRGTSFHILLPAA